MAETTASPVAPSSSRGSPFVTTHWSLVLAAGAGSSPQAAAALEELCRAYWYPLYAYVRRRGYAAPDAQDLTQAFFARLLERRTFAGIEREGGRFRSFLLTALSRFLRDEWEKLHAEKRGGGRVVLSLDEQDADERYRLEPADDLSADKLFARRWALTVLEAALEKLRAECASDGKARQFELLAPFLTDDVPDGAYEGLGRMGEADTAYQWAAGRLPGLEGLGRYAAFLARTGRRDEAAEAVEEMDRRIAKSNPQFRREGRAWRDLAARALAGG